MRLDNLSMISQPLQNSGHNKFESSEQRPVMQDVNKNDFVLEDVINTKKVDTVVNQLNEFMEPLRTNLKFELHEELNEYYVTVVNPITDEIIKEIPPKKMLDMYAKMAEFMGFLIDEKV
ncbi:flagellar protein FlaG [Ornithinibacillus sp. L9]|uniref:Flagellar protein FlaG n=1 Tax=Ornithinibacillus caprae TaxID=2678566 RepID=A0A6N8FRD5_9BACI|nr:flagellar protein FlaG [Ornithinibacillus caprae]MUK90799.1 flagellar protein FlaG [Ornithinibacillus caprae]